MLNGRLTIFAILSLSALSFSLDTLIFATRNQIGNQADTRRFEELFLSMVAPKLYSYGVVVIDSAQRAHGDVCYPSVSRSIIRCSIHNSGRGGVSKFRFAVSYGSEAYTMERELSWDLTIKDEQNMAILSAKIVRFFEENLLARVQMQSDPSYAQIEIDGKIKAATPFETFLPLGRHTFFLKLKGYDSLLADEVVTNGNNRFSFLLKPVMVKPEPQQIRVVVKEKQLSTVPWLIASVVLSSVAVFAGANYSETAKDYDKLISNDVAAYDRLNKEASRWLLVRNIAGTACLVTLGYSLYIPVKSRLRVKNG